MGEILDVKVEETVRQSGMRNIRQSGGRDIQVGETVRKSGRRNSQGRDTVRLSGGRDIRQSGGRGSQYSQESQTVRWER